MEELFAGLGEDTPRCSSQALYPDWVAEVWWREWGHEDA